MQVVRTLFLAVLVPAVLSAPQRVVSLEDVTGTTPRSPLAEAAAAIQGATQVGFGYNEHRPQQTQGGVVSLEDVTGSVEHTVPVVVGHPLPSLVPPQPRPARPGQQAGVVSLEDVTGHADNTVPAAPAPFGPWPRPLPPFALGPMPAPSGPGIFTDRDGHIYRPFAPRYPGTPDTYHRSTASGQNSVVCLDSVAAELYEPSLGRARHHDVHEQKSWQHDAGEPSLGRHRARRSPKPIGVVSLENVAGPVAAHYPAYGPPAYVRPNYYNNYYGGGGWYQRPRPYVYAVPCIGLFCL